MNCLGTKAVSSMKITSFTRRSTRKNGKEEHSRGGVATSTGHRSQQNGNGFIEETMRSADITKGFTKLFDHGPLMEKYERFAKSCKDSRNEEGGLDFGEALLGVSQLYNFVQMMQDASKSPKEERTGRRIRALVAITGYMAKGNMSLVTKFLTKRNLKPADPDEIPTILPPQNEDGVESSLLGWTKLAISLDEGWSTYNYTMAKGHFVSLMNFAAIGPFLYKNATEEGVEKTIKEMDSKVRAKQDPVKGFLSAMRYFLTNGLALLEGDQFSIETYDAAGRLEAIHTKLKNIKEKVDTGVQHYDSEDFFSLFSTIQKVCEAAEQKLSTITCGITRSLISNKVNQIRGMWKWVAAQLITSQVWAGAPWITIVGDPEIGKSQMTAFIGKAIHQAMGIEQSTVANKLIPGADTCEGFRTGNTWTTCDDMYQTCPDRDEFRKTSGAFVMNSVTANKLPLPMADLPDKGTVFDMSQFYLKTENSWKWPGYGADPVFDQAFGRRMAFTIVCRPDKECYANKRLKKEEVAECWDMNDRPPPYLSFDIFVFQTPDSGGSPVPRYIHNDLRWDSLLPALVNELRGFMKSNSTEITSQWEGAWCSKCDNALSCCVHGKTGSVRFPKVCVPVFISEKMDSGKRQDISDYRHSQNDSQSLCDTRRLIHLRCFLGMCGRTWDEVFQTPAVVTIPQKFLCDSVESNMLAIKKYAGKHWTGRVSVDDLNFTRQLLKPTGSRDSSVWQILLPSLEARYSKPKLKKHHWDKMVRDEVKSDAIQFTRSLFNEAETFYFIKRCVEFEKCMKDILTGKALRAPTETPTRERRIKEGSFEPKDKQIFPPSYSLRWSEVLNERLWERVPGDEIVPIEPRGGFKWPKNSSNECYKFRSVPKKRADTVRAFTGVPELNTEMYQLRAVECKVPYDADIHEFVGSKDRRVAVSLLEGRDFKNEFTNMTNGIKNIDKQVFATVEKTELSLIGRRRFGLGNLYIETSSLMSSFAPWAVLKVGENEAMSEFQYFSCIEKSMRLVLRNLDLNFIVKPSESHFFNHIKFDFDFKRSRVVKPEVLRRKMRAEGYSDDDSTVERVLMSVIRIVATDMMEGRFHWGNLSTQDYVDFTPSSDGACMIDNFVYRCESSYLQSHNEDGEVELDSVQKKVIFWTVQNMPFVIKHPAAASIAGSALGLPIAGLVAFLGSPMIGCGTFMAFCFSATTFVEYVTPEKGIAAVIDGINKMSLFAKFGLGLGLFTVLAMFCSMDDKGMNEAAASAGLEFSSMLGLDEEEDPAEIPSMTREDISKKTKKNIAKRKDKRNGKEVDFKEEKSWSQGIKVSQSVAGMPKIVSTTDVDTAISKVSEATFRVADLEGRDVCSAFVPRPGFVFLPNHFVRKMSPEPTEFLFFKNGIESHQRVTINPAEAKVCNKMDVACFDLKIGNSLADLTPFFHKSIEPDCARSGYLLVRNALGTMDVKMTVAKAELISANQAFDSQVRMYKTIFGNLSGTAPGDCMSPLLLHHSRNNLSLYGFHNWKSHGSVSSYSIPATYDMVVGLLSQFNTKIVHSLAVDNFVEDPTFGKESVTKALEAPRHPARHAHPGPTIQVSHLLKSGKTEKNQMVPHPDFEELQKEFPFAITNSEPAEIGKDHDHAFLSKINSNSRVCHVDCESQIIEEVVEYWSKGECSNTNPLTTDEAIYGSDRCKPLPMTSSSGGIDSMNRARYFEEVGVESICKMVEECESAYESGQQYMNVFSAFQKQENVQPGKVRHAFAGETVPLIAQRKDGMVFLNYFIENWQYCWCAFGMDPYEKRWHDFYMKLVTNSDLFVASDISGFDQSIPPEFSQMAIEVVLRFAMEKFGWKEKALRRLRTELCDLTDPRVFIRGIVVTTPNLLPSGVWWTSFMVSVINQLYSRYVFKKTDPDKKFEEYVFEHYLGDDMIGTVKPGCNYNCNTRADVLGKLGIKVTSFIKDEPIRDYYDVREVNFLSRKFTRPPGCPYYWGVIADTSVLKSAKGIVTSKHIPVEMQVYSTYENAAHLALAHGPEAYEAFKKSVRTICAKKKKPCPEMHPYDVMIYKYAGNFIEGDEGDMVDPFNVGQRIRGTELMRGLDIFSGCDGANEANEIQPSDAGVPDQENVTFTHTDGVVETQAEDRQDVTNTADAEYKSFFNREFLIHTTANLVGVSDLELDVWDLMMNLTPVKEKMKTFAMFNGRLRLRVEIITTPFMSGGLLFSYHPLLAGESRYRFPTNSLTRNSQKPCELFRVGVHEALMMEIPFIFDKPHLTLPFDESLGSLIITEWAPIQSLMETTPVVNMNIYATFDDINLSGVTGANEAKFSTIMRGGAKVARAVGEVIPRLGRVTDIVSKTADIAGTIAAEHGHSRPSEENINVYHHRQGGMHAVGDTRDMSSMLATTAANSTSIDPRIFDGEAADPLALKNIYSRYAYYTRAVLSTSHSDGQTLVAIPVHPRLATNGLTDPPTADTWDMLPCGLVSSCFTYARYTMKYRIRAFIPESMSVKLMVSWDPLQVPSGTETHNKTAHILDRDGAQEFEVEIGWGQQSDVLEVTDNMIFPTAINGTLRISVQQRLIASLGTAHSVYITVEACASDMFLALPRDPAIGTLGIVAREAPPPESQVTHARWIPPVEVGCDKLTNKGDVLAATGRTFAMEFIHHQTAVFYFFLVETQEPGNFETPDGDIRLNKGNFCVAVRLNGGNKRISWQGKRPVKMTAWCCPSLPYFKGLFATDTNNFGAKRIDSFSPTFSDRFLHTSILMKDGYGWEAKNVEGGQHYPEGIYGPIYATVAEGSVPTYIPPDYGGIHTALDESPELNRQAERLAVLFTGSTPSRGKKQIVWGWNYESFQGDTMTSEEASLIYAGEDVQSLRTLGKRYESLSLAQGYHMYPDTSDFKGIISNCFLGVRGSMRFMVEGDGLIGAARANGDNTAISPFQTGKDSLVVNLPRFASTKFDSYRTATFSDYNHVTFSDSDLQAITKARYAWGEDFSLGMYLGPPAFGQ